MKKIKKSIKGITLVALVVTVIVLLILAGVAISLSIGENGIFTRAQSAVEQYKASQILEQMEIIKSQIAIEDNGKQYIDKFWDEIIKEGIITSKADVINNEDGSYTIITNDGYIFDITQKEEGGNIEISYSGKGKLTDPRIKEIKVLNRNTNSIEVQIEGMNLEGGKYSYSYKKEEQEEYIEASHNVSENRNVYNNLEANKIYDIKVEVQTSQGKAQKTIKVSTIEMPIDSITFGDIVWENEKAKVTIDASNIEELTLEYKVNEDGNWIEIQSGGSIDNLELGNTVYARLTDGINETKYASISIKDLINPKITSFTVEQIAPKAIRVKVTASDNESGLAISESFNYYIGDKLSNSNENSNYIYENLSEETNYTFNVIVKDKAGNESKAEVSSKTVKSLLSVTNAVSSNTEVFDNNGNKIKIPKGFKVVNTNDNVNKGIVIEDVNAGDEISKGNQYVWVPIGKIYTNLNGEYKEINFGRYEFNKNTGVAILRQDAKDYKNGVTITNCQELVNSTYENVEAKNLEDFITKTQNNGGYYIGRYEAGDPEATEQRKFPYETSNPGATPVVQKGKWIYSYVNQKDAAMLATNMYSNNTNVQSDLVNSYAWDTAIVFIQTFSGDNNYSIQGGIQDTQAMTGNAQDESGNYDLRCNIYDMAGNGDEWSTETNLSETMPCVSRGGYYYGALPYFAAERHSGGLETNAYATLCFRTILYF